MPGSRSLAVIPRRAAHCVQTITVPAVRIISSRSGSGVACSRTRSAARPGRANQAASPVSHNCTDTPAAHAAAATVKAWLLRSAPSVPAVTLITRLSATGVDATPRGYDSLCADRVEFRPTHPADPSGLADRQVGGCRRDWLPDHRGSPVRPGNRVLPRWPPVPLLPIADLAA